MNWFPGKWEKEVEKLIERCAAQVLLELEESTTQRLREMGNDLIEDLLSTFPRQLENHAESLPCVMKDSGIASEGETFDGRKDDSAELTKRTDVQGTQPLWYAFAVIDSRPERLTDIVGMEGVSCKIVGDADLSMLVCPVGASEYEKEVLHQHMEDMTWVESHGRCHEEVLLQAMGFVNLLPLPFCTIFASEASIKAQLEDNRLELRENLERCGNNEEMRITLFANPLRLQENLSRRVPESDGSGGKAYFHKLQWKASIENETKDLMDEYGETLFQSLKELAVETHLLERENVVEPEGLRFVFAAEFLLRSEQRRFWQEAIEAFDRETDSRGFVLDISGPWPPYHFVANYGEGQKYG